jgi:hypothetical protein
MLSTIISRLGFALLLLFVGFSIGDPATGSKIFDTVVFGIYNNTIGLL